MNEIQLGVSAAHLLSCPVLSCPALYSLLSSLQLIRVGELLRYCQQYVVLYSLYCPLHCIALFTVLPSSLYFPLHCIALFTVLPSSLYRPLHCVHLTAPHLTHRYGKEGLS
jgi:hypothetical protein